jgi:hypothetical protein
MFLTACTQPIAPGVVDLRGLWQDPKKPDSPGERIEQCGLRIIITGGGVVHDTYIAGTQTKNGTLANGVVDVSYYDCSPINVAGRFNATEKSFTFYDSTGAKVRAGAARAARAAQRTSAPATRKTCPAVTQALHRSSWCRWSPASWCPPISCSGSTPSRGLPTTPGSCLRARRPAARPGRRPARVGGESF